jgi:acyl carrier protein
MMSYERAAATAAEGGREGASSPAASSSSAGERQGELQEQVEKVLLSFIRERYAASHAETLTEETLLLKQGIIDSLSMMSLILLLEQQYQLDFLTIDISRDDFASIRTLASFVVRSLQGNVPSGQRG